MADPRPAPAVALGDGLSEARVELRVAVASYEFDAVYAEHVGVVWRFLTSMGVRDADLEDVCQEVFVVVHRRLADFDGRYRLSTWLYAICFRSAAAYRRKAHFRRERASDGLLDFPVPPTQHDDMERGEAFAALRRALDALDDEKRAVFVLHEIDQVPMSDVAAAIGCPLKTAYGRLYAARRHVEAFAAALAPRGRTP